MEEIKIKGWIARDKSGDIHFFNVKPYREYPVLWWQTNVDIDDMFYLPPESFPEVKWEDEPVEVEIAIKQI